MCEPNPDATYDEPQYIHEYAQTTGLRRFPLHLCTEWPDGQQIAYFPIPENWTSNVCFGGKERDVLFITASKSVYTLKMLVHGANI